MLLAHLSAGRKNEQPHLERLRKQFHLGYSRSSREVIVLRRSILPGVLVTLAALLPTAAQQRNAGGRPLHNEAERAARWKPDTIPFHRAALTLAEQQMVLKLADACRLMDQLYWHQSDLGGFAMYHGTQAEVLARLFQINGSRWDLVDQNVPFVGEEPMPPGHELYTFGLKRQQIESYVAAHPEQKAAIYSPWTIVRSPVAGGELRDVPDRLEAIPYHVAFAQWLQPMAEDLRAAARLSSDSAFAHYLNLRAAALLSDDYYASDVAWLELKNPKIDLIFAPYETYLDGLLGVKTSYGGSILIRDEAETRKLAVYQQNEAAMQQALPIPTADKPSKEGHAMPMEVADAPLRAGDLHYGYQAVADNLPNDARIHAEKGSKKIFFRNFMNARVNNVILPIAAKLMSPEQAKIVSDNGYLTIAVLHEVSHGLGPAYAHVDGKQTDIREVIGPVFGGLEEAKADVTGIFLAKWLADRRLMTTGELSAVYASYVAGIFRTLRFGTGEAHGRAEMMEFNYLLEHNALTQNADGRYVVDFAAMPKAIEALSSKLLMFEAEGDRTGVEAWYAKYDVMPTTLIKALETTKDIPVDIVPEFELARGARP